MFLFRFFTSLLVVASVIATDDDCKNGGSCSTEGDVCTSTTDVEPSSCCNSKTTCECISSSEDIRTWDCFIFGDDECKSCMEDEDCGGPDKSCVNNKCCDNEVSSISYKDPASKLASPNEEIVDRLETLLDKQESKIRSSSYTEYDQQILGGMLTILDEITNDDYDKDNTKNYKNKDNIEEEDNKSVTTDTKRTAGVTTETTTTIAPDTTTKTVLEKTAEEEKLNSGLKSKMIYDDISNVQDNMWQ
mmetsp:Transcript_21597/g.24602  ORF Transcript_21597/g.24602 Transcript_21597/m.24602 type:complete len:246 (+) Transcript_21597:166-903(+)